MENRDKTFVWSDGWWVEGSNAWFVDGVSNVLFYVDLDTGRCEKICRTPDLCESAYRWTPFCLKCGREIFCIPGIGQSIWIYNLDDKLFTEINIDKPKGLQLASQFWIRGDEILIVPSNWDKIIEISISQKVIKNYYTVCEEDTVRKSVMAGDSIYMVSSGDSRIYQFDLTTKETKAYILPDVKKKLSTICFDGEKFWLSGYQKEIYIWDKVNDKVVTVDIFPANFEMNDLKDTADIKANCAVNGVKLPVFKYSIAVGQYIWFLPIRADKIIYADKETAVLSVFEIYDEDETEESIFLRQLWTIANYLLEYVRDDRYIGLFSAKSGRILEIDAQELSYQWKDYYLEDKLFFQCGGIHKQIWYEGSDDTLYKMVCRSGIRKAIETNSADRVGVQIHQTMAKERGMG